MFAVLLTGFVAYKQLAVSALPEVDYPTIQVVTFYPGASPDVSASAITAPLERQFGQLPGLNQMTSISSGGSSIITLQFALNLNIDVAEQEVQAAINAAQTYLPAGLPSPPIYSKSNPADAPIMTLAITSKTYPLSQVEDFTDTRLAQKISQVTGVGLVTISGGQKPAVRIQANPTALSSYGISLESLRSALQTASVNLAKGNFDGTRQAYEINANDQLLSSKDYQSLVVAYRNGAPVVLSDVAKVIDDVENTKLAAWANSHAGGHREHSAAARRKHHSSRGPRETTAAAAQGKSAGVHGRFHSHRPHDDDPRVGARRAIFADAHHRARRAGDFFVPAECLCHDHSQRRRAALARRHFGRHVSARLQPEQSHADGADDFHRLRRGRRHRDDRKCFSLHRAGRETAASRVERRGTNRLHHYFADDFADRRADSAVVHGRHRWPVVPRIRRDVERDDSRFRLRFVDAHADDVLAFAQGESRREKARPFF